MKQASLYSSTDQGGGKRRGSGMRPILLDSDRKIHRIFGSASHPLPNVNFWGNIGLEKSP
jgi:hypothetical protein